MTSFISRYWVLVHWSVFTFLFKYHSILIAVGQFCIWESWMFKLHSFSRLFRLFRITCFHMNFRINFSILAKRLAGILIGFVLNLWMYLGNIAILIIKSIQSKHDLLFLFYCSMHRDWNMNLQGNFCLLIPIKYNWF